MKFIDNHVFNIDDKLRFLYCILRFQEFSVGSYAYHFNLLSGSLIYPNHITWNANICATIRYTHLSWWWYLSHVFRFVDAIKITKNMSSHMCLSWCLFYVYITYHLFLSFFLFKYTSATWYKFPVFLFTISLFYVQGRLMANEKNTSFSLTYITIPTR